jgi:hypothetical protein
MTHLTALRPRLVRRLGAAIGSVVLAGASVAVATAPASAVDKMTHDEATAALSSSGITWSSSGNCSDRDNSTCTSFEQVNVTTIQGIQTLKSASGCSINVTGGTETGHADGTYSHWNGYKLDISKDSCVDGYITGTFSYIGGSKWQSAADNIYYDESSHWDITYYNCGGC